MIESILNFLTFDGVFSSLKDLFTNVVNWVITQITNTAYIIISPLIDRLMLVLPAVDSLVPQVNYIFNYATDFVNFGLDMCFISQPVLTYLVISLIARITLKNSTYVVKLVANWYHKLVP